MEEYGSGVHSVRRVMAPASERQTASLVPHFAHRVTAGLQMRALFAQAKQSTLPF
jgi:hypothetical protein